MIQTLYRPKRMRDGKRIVSRLYSARIRLDGEFRILNVPLGISDKQAAQEKLRGIVKEMEQEQQGLTPPKAMRDAAHTPLLMHVQEFIGDLRAKGRNEQYIDELENKLRLLADQCGWQLAKDVTADSFVKWRSRQKKSAKTLNEYLAGVKALFQWMIKQGRTTVNPLTLVQKGETRGKEVRKRRAYTDEEIQRLLDVAGQHRILYVMAALTGIRHGEFKKLCWGDVNLDSEKPSVMVRASVGKNKKQACLPLHPALLAELLRHCPANPAGGDLIFGKLVPRSVIFNRHLQAAGIAKKDSQGRVVDFHSFRHTFCTYLHRAGVPLREAMELMRHSDARLTMSIYADSSLFALRPAVEKLPWNYPKHDAQIDAQTLGAGGLLPSLAVTVDEGVKSEKEPMDMGLKSLSVTVCHAPPEIGKWSERQDSNLRLRGPKPRALARLSYAPTQKANGLRHQADG